ncbi:hypothetical protein [Psychrobacillus psychrodurans]|uniref:Uncharacterized protein n=1 Tax=Psychrobacillus psychrodurans TaxID=126157 RepID=A0A9X3LBX2_9BACI|nr:hypothetical protein [Psychrobacillus psychrodurans]MCZ8533379.1 hypothetical protein [Psychrobacillus psychrodurans]
MKRLNEVQVTEDFRVEVMMDSKTFNRKPDVNDVKGINYRIKDGLTALSIKQLGDEVGKGKTFMPAKLTVIDGLLKRSIKNWHSQQVVALDFDEAFTLQAALNDDFIRSNAAFLYTTFSHSDELHKFRVVFVLDNVLTNYSDFERVMTYLLEKFPQADEKCKDGSRLFYGGREVYWFDERNRLDSQSCINESLEWDRKNNLSISHSKTSASPKKKIHENLKLKSIVHLIVN